MCSPRNIHFKNGFASAVYIFIFLQELCWGQQRSRSNAGSSGSSASAVGSRAGEEFSCPEEFGYYPHPGDCTLYYVCVFGGALLESCTGGLMYSHELQTCDWPRNVGCGESNALEGPTVSSNRVNEPRAPSASIQRAREQPQQQQQQQQQHHQQVAKQLYEEEDLGPAEEEETDRQQRVYRGQPSTLSQVARDRDGLPRHTNALQTSPVSGRDKLSVVSFGSNQQYRTDPVTRASTMDIRHDKSDHFKTKRRRKRQLYSSRSANTRWPPLIRPGSKYIPHVSSVHGIALQPATPDNIFASNHYYLLPATQPHHATTPSGNPFQNYKSGPPAVLDLKSYFQLPNDPAPNSIIQPGPPLSQYKTNVPNATPNPIPLSTQPVGNISPGPWTAATSQDRTTLLAMRPKTQMKLYTPIADYTTQPSSIKGFPKLAHLANYNKDETVIPDESKGHPRNGSRVDATNQEPPPKKPQNRHRDEQKQTQHHYPESIRHHAETERLAESFENGANSESEGEAEAENEEADVSSGSNEAPLDFNPKRGRHKNIPLKILRNKLRNFNSHFSDPKFERYMNRLNFKMNDFPNHKPESSAEFPNPQSGKPFDFSTEDDEGDIGIDPQLLFTTPDTKNIGSFTPTPRPKPTKKPKNAITPLGISPAYAPANYSYPLNYGHKKTTKPYEPQDSTETYDDTEDGTSYPVTVPGTYTKDDDCVEYDDAKDGLTSYLSNNPPGHYYNSYPRHKSPDESSNYYPTPSGFPSKPRVKQKPEPEQEDNDEYYDDNEQYNDDGKKENPDEAEEYYDGYDDEEYAEDYKHEKPSKLISGSSVKPPRAPKMLQHLDSHTKPPSVNLSDAEYYDDEYYEDDEYYDETVTNKVTQPGPRRTTDKIRRNMTSITSDPLSQSSIDNYAIIKSSPSYHRRTRIHPGNTTKNDNLLEHTSPLNELSENNSPSYPATTTSHYLTKPKMRKKTTRYYQNLNSTTPNSLSVNSAFEQTNYKSDLISTPQVDTNSSGVNNFTISPKYRKNRQKLKNYATRNRNLPTQNTTESVVETGYRNSDRGRQNSLQFGGKSSLKNHRMPEETRPTDWNLLPFDKKSSNKIPPIPSSSSSNQKQFEDHTDNDEYKLPANHKILPSAGRLLTNPRAKLRQNLKQQKLINSPSNGQATDRVSVAPPNYIPQQQSAQVTASVSNRGIYNGTQYNPQQQQQFDSYYNLYNDESELYGDDVIFKVRQPKFSSATRKSALKSRNSKNYYGQYQVPNRGKHQPQIEIVQRLPEKNAVAYTPVQSYKTQENAYTPSYKTQGNVAYTPSYKQKQPDIYNVDDYNQQYSLQAANDDLSYQQPGLIGNKPSSIRLVPAGNESKVNETKQPLFPKSSTSHELNQQPSQRITLSAAFSLDNSPNSQLVQNPSTRVRPSSNFFIVKDNDDLPKPYQVSDLPDSFSNKKDIKNIEITRMRASGKSVPSRGTPKPTSSPTTFVVPTFPSRKQLNITAFSTDDPNFRIVVDPVKANKQSLVSPIGFKILDPTTKSNTPATFGTSHRDRVFKPRPFSPSEWIENINFTTEASPPQSNTHRFERVNFEKEIAELTKSGPSFLKAPVDFTTEGEFYRSGQGFSRTPIQYVTEGEPSRGASSFSKAPVQFTTEATTSRIAIRIPPKPATKIEQSTKKLDVTNTVSRFISDLSFTTKKPERGRPKLEGNDIQQFSTPSTTARYWASSKADSNLPGKAFPSKVEAKPTETSDFQGRSFFSSKNSPQTQNANAPSLHNSDNKPSRFDEVLDDEEYYDDDYYDDDELENDKLLPSSSPSTKALPPSTTQTPPKPSPFTYKPSIKIPVTSSPKEYSNPSKSGTRTLTRENEVSNVKESPLNPCSEGYERNSECNEKPLVRVRPTSASPESQASLDFTRGRQRGSATYTTASSELDRGTPLSSGGRPTLKPSNSIVSKASEFVDIYKFPPKRPDAVYPTPQVDKTAAKCRKDVCLLPDCYCGGKEVPGDLQPEETPQIVLLTFDDSVNDLNKGLYSDLFEKGRTNPNGCPISATFYVSHEWTDYSQVQNLYSAGHEIASHSVSHSFGEQFSQKKWTREIAGQREILSAYGGVKLEDIRGMRAPFLAVGGNKMFKMLFDSNFTYDSSMPVYENRPPSWPYTLDYKIFHDCMIPPCPTRSYPGVWEVPMVMWQDLNGGRCSMGDACSNPPTSDGVYKMLIKNFERHFTTNRAPFGLFYHAAWFTQPHHKEGFIAFLDTIVNMPEVWVVTNWQALQWVRDPTPISRLRNFTPFGCDYQDRPRRCNNPKVCNLWHKSGVRYMRTCQPCPEIYPWTGKTGIRNSKVDNEIIQD